MVNKILEEIAAQAEPVAWRDHVEQRIRAWRLRTMNEDGDCLAIDDFMSQGVIDDLVDFVCDECAGPQPARQPLTDEQIHLLLADDFFDGMPLIVDRMFRVLIRVIEKAHGIGDKE